MRAPALSAPVRLHSSTVPPRRAIAAAALAAMPPPLSMCSSERTLVGVSGNASMRYTKSSAACPTQMMGFTASVPIPKFARARY